MEGFSYRGKDVEFWRITGEVLGSNKYSETRVNVSSSGGGGYIGPNGGHVAPTTVDVSSTTVINHEFWIKTEDGHEKDVKFSGVDIPLRPGQKITLISAGRKGTGSGWYSILVNHSAGKHWFIKSAEELNPYLKLEMVTGKSLLIAGAIVCTGYIFYAPWELTWAAAGVFIVYRLVVKISRTSGLKKSLQQHLENLAQFAHKNY